MRTLEFRDTDAMTTEVVESGAVIGVVVAEPGHGVYKTFRVFDDPDSRRIYQFVSACVYKMDAIAELGRL